MADGLIDYTGKRSAAARGIVREVISISDLAISVDGAADANGWGTAEIADLHEGDVLFLGAVCDLTISTTAESGIQNAFDGDFSIGTAATADNSLGDSNEADIIASTALGAATGGVSPTVRGVGAGALSGAMINNRAGATKINLNLLIDNANISADGVAMVANGTLTIVYSVLGDA